MCKLDDEYTECCVDDQSCVIDDSDEEGKLKVCEDNKAVCGGRSDCNPDDGFHCVGNKVCCMDKEEVPCDASGSKSRVCCDPTIYVCKLEDGAYDCYDKEDAAPPPPPSGRKLRMASSSPSASSPTVLPVWARPSPAMGKKRQEMGRRPWRTAEGRAARRAKQLANRRGVSLPVGEEEAFLRMVQEGMAAAARPAVALRPPVVVRTWEDVVVVGGGGDAEVSRRRSRRQ